MHSIVILYIWLVNKNPITVARQIKMFLDAAIFSFFLRILKNGLIFEKAKADICNHFGGSEIMFLCLGISVELCLDP